MIALTKQAADAIEELGKLADAIPQVCECCIGCEVESGGRDRGFVLSPKRAKEYLNKPRWIPVTERLPPVDKEVLVVAYGSMMRIWNIHRLDPETADVCWECEDGTLDDMCVVTHWMPLPKPPKEE